MTVKDDTIQSKPSQHWNTRRKLIDNNDIVRHDLTERTPIGTRFERAIERGREDGKEVTKEGEMTEMVKECGEEEGDREMDLTEDRADDGEGAED